MTPKPALTPPPAAQKPAEPASIKTAPKADGPLEDSVSVVLLRSILSKLEELLAATVEAPRYSATENIEEVLIRQVIVVTAETPVQGPYIKVPKGYTTTIRLRHHSGTNPIGRVGFSQASVLDASARSQLAEGESIAIRVSNLDRIWLDSDLNSTEFELIVER